MLPPVTSTIRINSAPTNLFASASWSGASPTWQPMSAVCPPKISIAGSSIATLLQAAPAWPKSALRPALPTPLTSAIGESEMNHGAVAATSLPKNTQWSSAVMLLGYPEYGQKLSFIASGPNDENWNWTRGFFEEILRKGKEQLRSIYGIALHYYTWNLSRGATKDWVKGKGDAVQFDAVDWYELLREGDVMESLIKGHWQVMAESDPDHSVKLVVDEWGPWYRPGSEATPGDQLEQMPTLRDAVLSGMTLDIFNRHPEKVAMANCAQLINCLNSLYLAHEDTFCVTPVGHVFAMYAAHRVGNPCAQFFPSPTLATTATARQHPSGDSTGRPLCMKSNWY